MVEAVVPDAKPLGPDRNLGSGSDNAKNIYKVCFVLVLRIRITLMRIQIMIFI
jgi:hypothetical protein